VLPKTWDREAGNWVTTPDVPQIDEGLIEEARKRMVVMKYENGLRVVIQRARDGSADVQKLFNCISQAKDVEGIDAEIIGEARELMVGKCEDALRLATEKKQLVDLVIAASVSEGIPGIQEGLLEEVKMLLPEVCDEKGKNCAAQLTAACKGVDTSAIVQAITNAESLKEELEKVLASCPIAEVLYAELNQRLTVDASLLAGARDRLVVVVYEDSLGMLVDKFQQGHVHALSLQRWILQSTSIPVLANANALMIGEASQISCEPRIHRHLHFFFEKPFC